MSYYKLNINSNSNDLIYSKEHKSINSLGNLQATFSVGIVCERMDHISLFKLLVCFHENRINSGEIAFSFLNPENNFEVISSIPKKYIMVSSFLILIKSSISNNYKKSFVCYLLNYGIGAFLLFL